MVVGAREAYRLLYDEPSEPAKCLLDAGGIAAVQVRSPAIVFS